MNYPVSTYRLQFHKDFNFKQFQHTLPYLTALGVHTIYASPVFTAVPGSIHGYDGTDPLEINPEIGTIDQLYQLSNNLRTAGMQWLQDIVPNHMAYHTNNGWLMDVLEKGKLSEYATFFDTVHTSYLFREKLMVPFLGKKLSQAIDDNELSIQLTNDKLSWQYYNAAFPLHPRSYIAIFQKATEPLPGALQSIMQQIHDLHPVEDVKIFSLRWNEIMQQWKAVLSNREMRSLVEGNVQAVNADKELLWQIHEQQEYRLCNWQETDHTINYRRFFIINGLICLNMHNEKVFEQYHQLIKKLVNDNVFQGLRIDHIDGLYDPEKYVKDLRQAVGKDTYVVVEKILEGSEELPAKWPLQGNSGYDFMTMVNNVLAYKPAEKSFQNLYSKITGDNTAVAEQVHQKKAAILFEHMGGELENLTRFFIELELADPKAWEKLNGEVLKVAIAEWLIRMPVYRFYGNRFPLDKTEKEKLSPIFNAIRKDKKHLSKAIDVIETALFFLPKKGSEKHAQNAIKFYQRCMQFAGPLMAKGVEDTLMYTYNRFIGHNEVGGSLDNFGSTVAVFHAKMQQRQQHWPLSINATSTHDTKRGEDVRARLNVLTAIADEWKLQVKQWQKESTGLLKNGLPDANDAYFIYQSLLGIYPMPGEETTDIGDRLHEYISKALREAKVHSNWTTPDTEYEETAKGFISALLKPQSAFHKSFQKFYPFVAEHGIVNSLAQLIIKCTAPGVPDIYQGSELWDLTLVDPDNRKAVNYEKRAAWLEEMQQTKNHDSFIEKLWDERFNGKIKLWLTHTLLQARKDNKDIFSKGDYIPLVVKGKYRENILAFARRHKRNWVITIVPLYTAALCRQQKKNILQVDWKDTAVELPADMPANYINLATQSQSATAKSILIKDAFKKLPFAVLHASEGNSNRSAGILMPVFSLPSAFGIGDFGPEAKAFADFLYKSKQRYWQILPLNPAGKDQQYSPYSALSAMAGNPLFISPERLVEDGLLQLRDIKRYTVSAGSEVNYAAAEKAKSKLLDSAFQNFLQMKTGELLSQYLAFKEQEKHWLDDFAVFMVIKQKQKNKPWYKWPAEYKNREAKAMEKLMAKNEEEIEKEKWIQFIFSKQWHDLKRYCNQRGIELFGDLPIYTSYDSADVWSNRDIFCLDEAGNMTGVAGVPPDYFNSNGQLWGMPVFNWNRLQETGYAWWIQRIRKNFELFDLLRLDHFRAFSAYWQVPATDNTAKNGEWKPGPAYALFDALKYALGELPLVAEDLGDIDQPVYSLRDAYNMPGMKILQFAFGSDMSHSMHIPHNYTENFVAYSGTHDNNTTRGWYRREIDNDTKKRLEEYTGKSVSDSTAHVAVGELLYKSAAKIAILPMQDVLGLDETARINMPATTEKNWRWRMKKSQLLPAHIATLKEWAEKYNRI